MNTANPDLVPDPDRTTLNPSDLKMLARLRDEETNRHLTLFLNLLVAALLLFLFWDAPFALHRLDQLPRAELSKSPFNEVRFIGPWLLGVFMLIRGVYDCFFNRRRRLLLKMAKELQQIRK
jgi:hypothetical protein